MKKIVFGLCLYAAAMATQALELVGGSSVLNVVSVKNNRVAELFSFDQVTGQLNTHHRQSDYLYRLGKH